MRNRQRAFLERANALKPQVRPDIWCPYSQLLTSEYLIHRVAQHRINIRIDLVGQIWCRIEPFDNVDEIINQYAYYHRRLPYSYETLNLFAFSSDMAASYAIPVRRTSVLPAASFRFGLTTDTFAVQLTVPAVGPVEDFHLQVGVPCRTHKQNGAYTQSV